MKIFKLVSHVLAVSLAMGLAAGSAMAQNKKVIISQAFQSMLYLPLYVGINNGSFSRQGLDVVKETAGAPSAALAAVISGSAQFSLHGPEWLDLSVSQSGRLMPLHSNRRFPTVLSLPSRASVTL